MTVLVVVLNIRSGLQQCLDDLLVATSARVHERSVPFKERSLETTHFTVSFSKEPNIGQNKDSLVGWLGSLASDFLFVWTAFWLLCHY